MRPATSTAAAAAAAALLAATCMAAESWQRTWTVERVLCPRCDAARLAELRRSAVGQRITLAPDRFENPLYESCDRGAVDYADLHARPRTEAGTSLHPGPSVPLTEEMAVAGTVRCALSTGPPNTVARFVFDGATGYYLHEGGAVMVLR